MKIIFIENLIKKIFNIYIFFLLYNVHYNALLIP